MHKAVVHWLFVSHINMWARLTRVLLLVWLEKKNNPHTQMFCGALMLHTGWRGHTSSSSLGDASVLFSLVFGIEYYSHEVPRKLISQQLHFTIIFTLQVLSNLPTLPETEQHLWPFSLHLTANPGTSHKVSCIYHVYNRTKKTSFLH